MLGQVAAWRNSPPRFATGDLRTLCDTLRVPKLSNPGVTLKRAEGKTYVRSYQRGIWALTPLGDQRVRVLLQDMDTREIEAALASEGVSGALFDDVRHALLPATFAPRAGRQGSPECSSVFPLIRTFCA